MRLAASILLGLCVLTASAHAEEMTKARNVACQVPLTEAGLTADWHGSCIHGLAEGNGVLRYYDTKGQVVRSFLGDVHDGHWNLGVVIDGSGGLFTGQWEMGYYRAGKAVDGIPPDVVWNPNDGDENAIAHDRALNAATQAATVMAAWFAQRNNASSGGFYRKLAKDLADQID
jgi:hypothetical protein